MNEEKGQNQRSSESLAQQGPGGGFSQTHAQGKAHAEQPSHFAFDEASEREVEKFIARYPAGKQASAVIPLLYVVQKQMGRSTGSAWVPRVAMDVIAQRRGMPAQPPG